MIQELLLFCGVKLSLGSRHCTDFAPTGEKGGGESRIGLFVGARFAFDVESLETPTRVVMVGLSSMWCSHGE